MGAFTCVYSMEKVSGMKIKSEILLATPEAEPKYDKAYICEITGCGKAYSWAESLRLHKRTHKDDAYKWTCEECGKKFMFKSVLEDHKELHNPFRQCKVCGALIATKRKFDRHMQRCDNNFKYPCDLCGKGFTKEGKFVEHLRTHTKEKPYTCEKCGVSFARKGKLKTHTNRHNGIKNYKCEYCPWEGYESSDRAHHMKKHRKNVK